MRKVLRSRKGFLFQHPTERLPFCLISRQGAPEIATSDIKSLECRRKLRFPLHAAETVPQHCKAANGRSLAAIGRSDNKRPRHAVEQARPLAGSRGRRDLPLKSPGNWWFLERTEVRLRLRDKGDRFRYRDAANDLNFRIREARGSGETRQFPATLT